MGGFSSIHPETDLSRAFSDLCQCRSRTAADRHGEITRLGLKLYTSRINSGKIFTYFHTSHISWALDFAPDMDFGRGKLQSPLLPGERFDAPLHLSVLGPEQRSRVLGDPLLPPPIPPREEAENGVKKVRWLHLPRTNVMLTCPAVFLLPLYCHVSLHSCTLTRTLSMSQLSGLNNSLSSNTDGLGFLWRGLMELSLFYAPPQVRTAQQVRHDSGLWSSCRVS